MDFSAWPASWMASTFCLSKALLSIPELLQIHHCYMHVKNVERNQLGKADIFVPITKAWSKRGSEEHFENLKRANEQPGRSPPVLVEMTPVMGSSSLCKTTSALAYVSLTLDLFHFPHLFLVTSGFPAHTSH